MGWLEPFRQLKGFYQLKDFDNLTQKGGDTVWYPHPFYILSSPAEEVQKLTAPKPCLMLTHRALSQPSHTDRPLV